MAKTDRRALTYAAAQAARVAFYGAHYLAARVLARENFARIDKPQHRFPSLGATARAMRALFAKDWANVEAGLYKMPVNVAHEMRKALVSVKYLADIPKVVERQTRRGHSDVNAPSAGDVNTQGADDLPRYYRQNFHFQTDGYLSEESARLYEFQVEALFAGTADAMRRQAYVPLAKFLKGRDPAKTKLLDVGAGTGGFLSFVKSEKPELAVIALDLSKPYLDRAARRLQKYSGVECVSAPAENMPLKNESVNAAVSIYLFHELPPKIRIAVANEIARVLKPGGLFVLADSIQYGDAPEFDGLLDAFPGLMHEPYYASYAETDLKRLFADVGLMPCGVELAYLTKVMVFTKEIRPSARGGAVHDRPKRTPSSLRQPARRGFPRKDRGGLS